MIAATGLDATSSEGFGFVVLVLIAILSVAANILMAWGTIRRRPPIEVDLAGKADISDLEEKFVTRREWAQFTRMLEANHSEATLSRERIYRELRVLLQRTSKLAGYGEQLEEGDDA